MELGWEGDGGLVSGGEVIGIINKLPRYVFRHIFDISRLSSIFTYMLDISYYHPTFLQISHTLSTVLAQR